MQTQITYMDLQFQLHNPCETLKSSDGKNCTAGPSQRLASTTEVCAELPKPVKREAILDICRHLESYLQNFSPKPAKCDGPPIQMDGTLVPTSLHRGFNKKRVLWYAVNMLMASDFVLTSTTRHVQTSALFLLKHLNCHVVTEVFSMFIGCHPTDKKSLYYKAYELAMSLGS